MKILTLAAIAAVPVLWADFRYEETSRMTGGILMQMSGMPIVGGEMKKALEPQTATVSIQGDKLIRKSADRANIIDVGAETMTDIDYAGRTYTVTTFAQMRERFENAMQRMNADSKNLQTREVVIDVKETGRTKAIDGISTKEVVLTMKVQAVDPKSGQSGDVTMNTVMWIGRPPGAEEAARFYQRMAEKMKVDLGGLGALAGGGPAMSFGKGMADFQKKVKAMDGTPILQVITMGTDAEGLPKSIDIPDTTEAMKKADAEAAARQEASRAAVPSMKDAVAGALAGRFGGFGGRKKVAAATPAAGTPAAGTTAMESDPGVLMQMRMTQSGFSSATVDSALFAVPAGFARKDVKN